MKDTTKELFFAALLPPEPILQEITDFKEYAATHFEAKKALTSPPHITVQPPFRRNVHDILPVQIVLKAVAAQHQSFKVNLQGFQAFPPRVIYVDVELNDALAVFNNAVKGDMKTNFRYEDHYHGDFKPHITVAYRDLQKTIYPKAWKYFSKVTYNRTFKVTDLTLLKHNGSVWEIFEQYPLALGE